jgi:hypothetical protein
LKATAPAAPANAPAADPEPAGQVSSGSAAEVDFRLDASEANTIGELPDVPALYALYGGRGEDLFGAYVGVTDDLRARIEQHLIRRDSSVATGTSAVSLNPDYVTEVRWWTHPTFLKHVTLEAARLVALDVIEPALRGGGQPPEEARRLYKDPSFVQLIKELIQEQPAGHLVIRSLDDAWDRIEDLQRRLTDFEQRLIKLEGSRPQ